jgi:hypothetical protein
MEMTLLNLQPAVPQAQTPAPSRMASSSSGANSERAHIEADDSGYGVSDGWDLVMTFLGMSLNGSTRNEREQSCASDTGLVSILFCSLIMRIFFEAFAN